MRSSVLFLWFFLLSITGFSQSVQLAKNYYEQGEFKKALHTYQELVAQQPNDISLFYGMIAAYQQLEKYKEAEEALREKIQTTANEPSLLVELGHNYVLRGETKQAELYYKEALFAVQGRPNFTLSIARAFQKYSLLDRAISAYEMGMEANPQLNYNMQLAQLYGEQGQIEKMFSSYLALIEENPDILPRASRLFSRYISHDSNNEANAILRKLLLRKLQEAPKVVFNELLSWLFVQQRDFGQSFSQEKAVYNRSAGKNMGRIIQLALLARDAEDYKTAVTILEFIIENSQNKSLILQAHQIKLAAQQQNATPKNYGEVAQDYRKTLSNFGYTLQSLPIILDFTRFLAFKQDKNQEAEQILERILAMNPNATQEANIKMTLADILVLDHKFNQALIYYSQVEQLVGNSALAQKARFKVAKTSYYKGDFDWAKTQLDVLKSASSQLIANDAMELSLLISENSAQDSLQEALRMFAKADLLQFQHKGKEAISTLKSLLIAHKGKKIEDEALLKLAQLFESNGQFAQARDCYLKLIRYHKNGILGDNAFFGLAQLYNLKFKKPKLALKFYEEIIFNYPDSIYFVTARNTYRDLRGNFEAENVPPN